MDLRAITGKAWGAFQPHSCMSVTRSQAVPGQLES